MDYRKLALIHRKHPSFYKNNPTVLPGIISHSFNRLFTAPSPVIGIFPQARILLKQFLLERISGGFHKGTRHERFT
ncbi:hypothetical protein [Serratia plymuthica]|uniref:hypothetical protein n=1 Tax=Serratia plymuthica TaxID=82996 RepID=UPI0011147616|nr:hypothetical protein [Serratia plymuthica]